MDRREYPSFEALDFRPQGDGGAGAGELTGELMIMRRRWLDTQELIAKWKAAAEMLKPPRGRKAQPLRDGEFLF